MNYRTKLDYEDELLLSNSSRKAEDISRDRSSRPNVSRTLTSKKQSQEEKLINNTADTTTLHEGISESDIGRKQQHQVSGDNNRNVSYITGDISQGRYATTSNKWVSFDESSGQRDILAPKQKSPVDSSKLEELLSEDDWVKFENTKEINDLNSSANENTINNSLKQGTHITHQIDGSLLSEDVTKNPFSNSEIDRISSFSKSSNNVNGISTKPIKPPSSQVTSDHDVSEDPKETHAAITRKVDMVQPTESFANDSSAPLPAYPVKTSNTTWSMLLRYPDTKRRIRSREWRPIVLKLNGSILQVYDEHDTSTPFREVSLQCFYDLTKPRLQHYNGCKVHTVKILYVKYKETQKLIAKKNVLYIAKTTPILKLASYSHTVINEFIEVVRDAIRSLPIFRDRGISHNTEAVYVNVHDTCTAIIDATGSVLMLGILVRIYLRAFISGDAECELVLNDFHMKTQEEARLREELMPQRVHKWIKLEECDFHSTVDSSTYNENHCIVLHPLDSCTFEVMQFRVRPEKPLPLLAKCELIVESHGRVELRAEVKLCSDTKLAKYERKNICLYFPIPEAWVQLFMREKRFRGEKSIKSTNSQKAIKMRNQKNRPLTTIEVTTGSAKYEPEFKSIVWRINQLPLLNTTSPADSTHDFTCHIQTMDSSSLPDDYKPQCQLEYDIPYTVASDTNVVNFKVLDKKIARKEVSYHTYYTYEIQMNITSLNGGLNYDR